MVFSNSDVTGKLLAGVDLFKTFIPGLLPSTVGIHKYLQISKTYLMFVLSGSNEVRRNSPPWVPSEVLDLN